MPSLLVCVAYFSRSLAIPDGFIKVFTCKLRASNHMLMLILGSGQVYTSFNLLIFEVEIPLAQLEVAITQLLRVLNFSISDHFVKHWYGVLLLIHIIIVFKDRQFNFCKLILDFIGFIWVLLKKILLFNEVKLQFIENSRPKTLVAWVLSDIGKVNKLVNFFNFINNDTSKVETSLECAEVFWWEHCKSLLPEAVDVTLALFVVGPDVEDDLFKLLETLQILDERISSWIWLSKERSDFRVKNLSGSFDMLVRVLILVVLYINDGVIEALLERVRSITLLQDLDIFWEVGPLTKVEGAFEAVVCDLEKVFRWLAETILLFLFENC